MYYQLNYNVKTPCKQCPFLTQRQEQYTDDRLEQMAYSGNFHCHKTGDCDEEGEDSCGEFIPNENSSHCAGALILLQRRGDIELDEEVLSKLNMNAPVRDF